MNNQSNFTIYNASAGAGKTYTLVKNFLILVLGHDNPYHFESILAITFTNKAANEMKYRMLLALRDMANDAENVRDMAIDLSVELNISPEKLRQKSKLILVKIIHHYSRFSVSTIDKFNLRLMKAFAQDLGLSLNFDVQLDTDEILQQAVDLLYARIGEDKLLTEIVIDIAQNNFQSDRNWDIRKSLQDSGKELFKENNLPYFQHFKNFNLEALDAFRKYINEELRTIESHLKEIGENQLILATNLGLTDADFYQKSKGVLGFYKKLKEKRFEYPKETITNDYLEGISVSKSKNAGVNTFFIDSHLAFSQAKEMLSDYPFLLKIKSNFSSFSLLNEVERALDEIRKEDNLLLISDFNQIISKHLQEQPAGFIYEKIGNRVQHYFIDEFQDTSTLQWQNFAPLIEDAMATDASVMLVGDVKQSIYRWRGGNPRLMVDLVQKEQMYPIAVENLPKNWRSHQQIVAFNNNLFDFLAGTLPNETFKKIYLDTVKQEQNSKKGGAIRIHFIETFENVEAFKEINLTQIEATVAEVVSQGFAYQEITILTRSNKEGKWIASFLEEKNIPVISDESLLLSSAFEVRILVELFQISYDPKNKQSKANLLLLMYQSNMLAVEDISAFIVHSLAFDDFYKNLKTLDFDFSFLQNASYGVYDLAERCIRTLKWHLESNPYLFSFLDLILEFSHKNDSDLFSFLNFWETKKDKASISVPESLNAIRLMTIHKSKGLEFPVVILPFLNWKAKTSAVWVPFHFDNFLLNDFLLSPNDDLRNVANDQVKSIFQEETDLSALDELNVLYVATTRAVEQLHVIASGKSSEKSTLAGSLKDFTAGLNDGFWDENTFGLGELIRVSKPKIKEIHVHSVKLNSLNWENKLVFAKNSEKIWQTEEKTKFGNLVHDILAQINHIEDAEFLLQQEFVNGTIDQQDNANVKAIVTEIIHHPMLSAYYQPGLKVLNEREFLDENSNLFRADRVVIDGRNCVVIDYKTGHPKTQDKDQILNYADFFRKLGYHIKGCYLVYISMDEQASLQLEKVI